MMPLQRCTKDGKPGWKWGDNGACFPYTPGTPASELQAKRRAMAQAAAISYSQKRAGQKPDIPV